MKYETPEMNAVAFEVKEAIAEDSEYEYVPDFGDMISENSMPKA